MKKQNTGMDALGYALYAFGALGMEILVLMIEENLYGIKSGAWTDFQHQMHWLMITLIWGVFAYVLFRQRKQFPMEPQTKLQPWWALGFFLLAIGCTSMAWNGWKPWIEYQNLGLINFLFLYMYYAMESTLILLILLYGELAFAIWFPQKQFPFGAILLALTWGLIHILTQGIATGMYTVLLSLLYGCFYHVTKTNLKLSFLGILLMFMV